jgi:hypothetical protein
LRETNNIQINSQVIQQLYERLSQNPQQMANLIKTLPAPTGQALTELLRQYAMAQAQANAGGMATATQSHQQQPTAQASNIVKNILIFQLNYLRPPQNLQANNPQFPPLRA